MLSSLFLIAGVIVLGIAFRSFRHPICQRMSLLCLLGASFLIGYLPGHSWIAGFLVAAIWPLLPWLEILTRVRTLRLPIDRTLRQRTPPNRDIFPNLDQLTEEIETEGFELVDDMGYDWESQQQFLRVFHRDSDRTLAAVCLVDQGDIAFYYISLVARGRDGETFTTWNYPFSYSLKAIPANHICRVRPDIAFHQLCTAHASFLRKRHVSLNQIQSIELSQIRELLQNDIRNQIHHNVAVGLLAPTNDREVRYTWRGMFYLWFRFIWDFVRL
jgi:hypothetical protein